MGRPYDGRTLHPYTVRKDCGPYGAKTRPYGAETRPYGILHARKAVRPYGMKDRTVDRK